MAAKTDVKSNEAGSLPLREGDAELVTYVPGEGDPHQVKWRGHAFRANVPKPVKNAEHIEAARGNPYFHVGPFDPAKHGQPTVVKAGPVTDGRSYRAHVAAWLKTCETAEDLVSRWAGDQKIRDLCEDFGADDIAWIGAIIEPKMASLLARDDVAPDQQAAREAQLWQRYGVAIVPWRSHGEEIARGMQAMA